MVTTVARFRHTSETEGLLRHIGAISELAGMRYWSTTHKQWQTLIVEAYALTGLQPNLWRTTIERNTPELKEHVEATWDNKATSETYIGLLRKIKTESKS